METYKVETKRITLEGDDQLFGEVRFKKSDVIDIYYVYVHPDHRGEGIADDLMDFAYRLLKDENKKIVASCSYAKEWLERNGVK